MAVGWISVLSNVPWSDVIRNAPKVAEGARKLWNRVNGKPAAPEAPPDATALTPTPESPALATLQARTAALEAAVADLQSQLVESSVLIKQLADLNEQLIARVDVLRRRQRLLAWALGLLALVVVAGALLAAPLLAR